MANAISKRNVREPAHGGGSKGPVKGRGQKDAGLAQAGDGGSVGPWSDYWVAQCKDGKARRIGAGIQPLAYGVPGRVGQLRAYGNAIVALEAAVFVRASIDYLRGPK